MAKTSIEWTDFAWNMIRARNLQTGKVGWYCEKVSAGCALCYAEPINEIRFGTGLPYKPGHREDVEIFISEKALLAPLRLTKPLKIFACSMTDLFGPWVEDAMLDRIVAVMALAHWHVFQTLTKRSARQLAYFSGPWRARVADVIGTMITAGTVTQEEGAAAAQRLTDNQVLPNLWAGVSAEDQATADERVAHLLLTPAAVRIVSAEPLLGAINFTRITVRDRGDVLAWQIAQSGTVDALTGTWADFPILEQGGRCALWTGAPTNRIDQIITGGQTGLNAQAMHPSWPRSVRDQCAAAGVAYFHKQNGEWRAVSEGDGDWYDSLYRSRVTARRGESQDELDDLHGRRCTVPTIVLHSDGTAFEDPAATGAHQAGTGSMLMFRVGRVLAGRRLDSVEHNGVPA